MGITTDLRNVVSMPLGTNEVLPIDMAGAMASIAADGLHADPYLVDRVEDQNGKTIFTHHATVRRAASSQSARLAMSVLQANVRSGTGTRARVDGQHAGGKTGTGDSSSDAWFVGATPYLATAVWLGSPTDNQAVVIKGRGITGGVYPAEIWGRYMRAWHEGKPDREFAQPAPTRSGRYLQLPGDVDPGGRANTPSTLFPGLPPDFTLPPGFTLPPNFTVPTGPSGPPSTTRDPRFPPGFPFDDG
jgi:penicillin-binding protein 1A